MIELVPYTPRWSVLFAEEQAQLDAVLGTAVRAIEHIGSTAIPGIVAKPILDIGIAVDSFEEAAALVPAIVGLGYTYRGEYSIPRRHYFVKGKPRTHHLHMVEISSEGWRNNLLFRDYLRNHPDTAAAYAQLKQELAISTQGDRVLYTDSKAPFVRQVLEMARLAATGAGT